METLAPVVIGAIITVLTQIAKKWNISNRLVLAGFVIIAALGYSAFQYFVDEVTKEQITSFTASTFGSAVFFYEYFVRFIEQRGETVVNKVG